MGTAGHATGLLRLADERAERDGCYDGRPDRPGTLAPMQRVTALGGDRFVETGALARSQHSSDQGSTARDGLITGFAEIEERQVAVAVEDPVVLARTDGAVAHRKRHRLLSLAAGKDQPVVYVADGPQQGREPSTDGRGFTGGLLAPALPDLSAHLAPRVLALLGPCRDSAGILGLSWDVLVRRDDVPGLDSPHDWAPLMVTVEDDLAAMAAVRHVLALLPSCQATALPPLPTWALRPDPVLEDDSADTSPARVLDGVLDEGSRLDFSGGGRLASGLGTVAGHRTAYIATSSGSSAGALEVAHVAKVARLCQRFDLPLLCFQDSAGYGSSSAQAAASPLAIAAAAAAMNGRFPKISVITGVGHALGTWLLGGRQLGFDYILAWPFACVGVSDGPHEALDGDSADGPWLAAGAGVVDDVMRPSETRARLAQMLGILSRGRALPSPESQRTGRLVVDTPTV